MSQVPPDGIRVLAREKSLGEQFLTLMDMFGRQDVGQYAKGVTLYAEAKAEFDGLISALEQALEQPRPPDQSATFQVVLDRAVEKRVAFTGFVSDTILPQNGGTTKGIGDFIKVVPELITALTKAEISIWQASHSAGEARRTEMRQELEAVRWPPFKP